MSGVSPNTLKRATIQPHFKTGSKTDVNNYRPISILPAFGKIFQKIMKIKNLDFIEKFKVLREIQFGSRNRRSTVDALVNVVENEKLEKEKGNNSTMVFLDLKKGIRHSKSLVAVEKIRKFWIQGSGFKLVFFISQTKNTVFCSASFIFYTVL